VVIAAEVAYGDIIAGIGARELAAQSDLLRCIFGNPFRPITIERAWLTPDVVGLAQRAYEQREFARLPHLADALQRHGCADAELLGHLRSAGPHVLGCWALDAVLDKK
jgi:hypothetical protein